MILILMIVVKIFEFLSIFKNEVEKINANFTF